jgi:hypothetical protein
VFVCVSLLCAQKWCLVCAPSTEEDNVYALIIYGSMDRRVVNLIALFFVGLIHLQVTNFQVVVR